MRKKTLPRNNLPDSGPPIKLVMGRGFKLMNMVRLVQYCELYTPPITVAFQSTIFACGIANRDETLPTAFDAGR